MKPDEDLDTITQLFRVGIKRADSMFSYITEYPLQLQISSLEILPTKALHDRLEARLGSYQSMIAMELNFSGEFQGTSQVIFPTETSKIFISIIADEERKKLDAKSYRKDTISEVGNIFFNGIMGAISTVIDRGITYMMPTYVEGNVQQLLSSKKSGLYAVSLLGTVQVKVDQKKNEVQEQLRSFSKIMPQKYGHLSSEKSQIIREIIFFFKVNSFKSLVAGARENLGYFEP